MKLADITTVGRSIDLNYPTNRAIALLVVAVGAGGAVVRLVAGSSLIQSIGWGAGAAFAVFFAWALGRELDPDHGLSAFVAAGLILVGLFFVKLPTLLALLWTLLLLRIVNRTPGVPATLLDSLGALGIGGWLAWQEPWVYGLVTALAFLADAVLRPQLRRQGVLAGLALIPTAAALWLTGPFPEAGFSSLPGNLILLVGATCVLYVFLISDTRRVAAVGDRTGQPLNPARVRTAQALALVAALLIAWWDGAEGILSLLPLWAAMLGVALYRVFVTVVRLRPSHSGYSQE